MSKAKKISVNAFEKAVKDNYNSAPSFEWCGITIDVKRTLSFDDMLSFVDGVVNSCFTESTGEYIPEVKQFALERGVIEFYSNLSLPSNIGLQYELITKSHIADEIIEHINTIQYITMLDAIDEKIDSIVEANVNMLNKQFNELAHNVEEIITRLGETFSEVSTSDLSKLITVLGNGGEVDEEKVVKALLDSKKE